MADDDIFLTTSAQIDQNETSTSIPKPVSLPLHTTLQYSPGLNHDCCCLGLSGLTHSSIKFT